MNRNTDQDERAVHLLNKLIEKLELHAADKSNRSFGDLKHLIQVAKDAQRDKKYRDPLFFVNAPRWLGEWGNTPLEDEICSIICELDLLVVEICGGRDRVNAARVEHNQRILSKAK